MKILVISNLYPPEVLGGYEILCGQVCQSLARRGHDLRILTSNHPGGASPADPSDRIERTLELVLPFDRPGSRARLRRVRVGRRNFDLAARAIADCRPELIFMWSQLRLSVGPARAAERSGLPVVYTFNDENIAGYLPAPFGASPVKAASHLLDRWLLPGITLRGLKFPGATCISRTLKTNLLARGLPLGHAEVIYQGIPIEQFPLKDEPGSVRGPRLLYVGQLHHYKGVHTFVEAVKSLRSSAVPGLTATIVGDGPEEYVRGLRRQAETAPAAFRFAGQVAHSELPAVYRGHDLFVFPSLWQEPFGLTHLEAMASGTPVVSTNDGGHGEFLEDGRNCLVFAKGDHRQLAAQILRLLDHDGLGPRLAVTARAMVEERFSLEGYVDALENLLLRSGRRAA